MASYRTKLSNYNLAAYNGVPGQYELNTANIQTPMAWNTQVQNPVPVPTTPPAETGSTFGQIFGTAAAGNIAGAGLSFLGNMGLQHLQHQEQEHLQERAAKLNERAVQTQALNQVNGMRNAGLNPAAVNGAGAPSVQAGAAAGGTMQLSNIFAGLAELVTALKAPSEIEKTEAETGKTIAETTKTEQEMIGLLPEQIENLKASTGKINEEMQNLKNINEIYESQDKYMRSAMQDEYTRMMEGMKKNGTWKDLGEKTRETIERIASGDDSIGVGELKGMMEVVNSQKGISEADRLLKQNQLANRITNIQLKEGNVQKALARMPKAEYDKIVQEKKNLEKLREKIIAETDLAKQEKLLKKYNEETGKANDEMWQRIYGDKELGKEIRNKHIRDGIIQGGIDALKGAVQGGAIGAGGAVINKMLQGKTPEVKDTYPHEGPIYKGGLQGYQDYQYDYHHPGGNHFR